MHRSHVFAGAVEAVAQRIRRRAHEREAGGVLEPRVHEFPAAETERERDALTIGTYGLGRIRAQEVMKGGGTKDRDSNGL